MSFDKETRNLLAKTVTACRRRLTEDVIDQLQGVFGLHPDGTVLPLDKLTHLSPDQAAAARRLRDLLDHYTAGAAGKEQERRKAAYERMVLEISFTALNRLAALRLCEERGLIVECVRKGTASDGFRLFERISGGALGTRYDAYRVFLECMFDELGLDLGVLFDRMTPQSAVFPGERCLEDVLAELNKPELMHLWTEDETIGWIYQYFNPPEERKAMREASQAPRNSRELAVRNQFFTPRYVVEFLTDNTLGRIWYEMRRGDTALKEECRYLVRRPCEIFLSDGHLDTFQTGPGVRVAVRGDFSRLPEEPTWDDLQVLALCLDGYQVAPLLGFEECGDLHKEKLEEYRRSGAWQGNAAELWCCLFFEQRIWRSAEEEPEGEDLETVKALYRALRAELTKDTTDQSQEELLKLPVFIPPRPRKDPRDLKILDPACGSGHFLLYAFDLLETIYAEAWEDDSGPASEVTGRSLREDYADLEELRRAAPELILRHNLHGIDIDPRAVQIATLALWLRAQKSWKNQGLKAVKRPQITKSNLVTAEPMPGEEDLRREFIADLRPRVLGRLVDAVFDNMKLAGEAGSLLKIEEEIKDAVAEAKKLWLEAGKPLQQAFPGVLAARPKQEKLRYDLKEITDEGFWEDAEELILTSLKHYAEWTENGRATRRRLFAEDTARGFAFIDLCREKYDVALMNPPFGEPPLNPAVMSQIPAESARNMYGAMVLRTMHRLNQGGKIGCITDRTFLLLPTYQQYRDLVASGHLIGMADLGWGVLDDAQVATCAYIISAKDNIHYTETWFIDARSSQEKMQVMLECAKSLSYVHLLSRTAIESVPTHPLSYWAPFCLRKAFRRYPAFEPSLGIVRKGLSPGDSDRFVKLCWEIPDSNRGLGKKWAPYANGGEFSPYFRGTKEVVNWDAEGHEIKGYCFRDGRPRYVVRSAELYGTAGLTFGKRGEVLNVQILPAGQVISNEGYLILPKDNELFAYLGFFNSNPTRFSVNMVCGLHKEVGAIKVVPVPDKFISSSQIRISKLAREACDFMRMLSEEETNPEFSLRSLAESRMFASIKQFISDFFDKRERMNCKIDQITNEIDCIVGNDFGIDKSSRTAADEEMEAYAIFQRKKLRDSIGHVNGRSWLTELTSCLLGISLGRWDVRLVLDSSLLPKMPDPFAPLPVCPPGMLVGPDGLPAEPDRIVSEEWLRARPDAGTLPPAGAVKKPVITDDEYPLRISWDGVLVDDPGFNGAPPHREDIVRRVREALDLIWKDKAPDIEQEACEILGVSDLREYFRRPGGFFQDHLKRYSKSRRKAPIYWPLSTASGSYTVWLYYHRLTDQTLYLVANKYVEPKIAEVERGLARLEEELASASGRDAARLRDRLNEGRTFLGELRDFREELLRVAALPYKPNLNDGVIINAAPLHKLFRLRSWAKDTEECWKKLQKGDYDWAHLAYTIWPDRVREVCKKDRSIAIAHGLEDICEIKVPEKAGKKSRRKKV